MNIRIPKIAGIAMAVIFSGQILFHLLIITKVLPYSIVWGGKLRTPMEMYRLEAIAVLMNVCFLLIVLGKRKVMKLPANQLVLTISLWVMCVLFFVNTLGNLISVNKWEQLIFTPMTIILCICSAVLARTR
ncbi:hypothetical protein [Chitinophaga arvensicola]|uniref:Uncharacterized protein n=1 Tax=Chitinophaga arvensicola TaxID=29529 RepID=A0A1I0R4R2_9BACT|nr:hypothetical protein [Chitinophaga arvensicola]SEW35446.1 hypothetical protein SAMN04488122_2246 [Chitinophaga arvensicola]